MNSRCEGANVRVGWGGELLHVADELCPWERWAQHICAGQVCETQSPPKGGVLQCVEGRLQATGIWTDCCLSCCCCCCLPQVLKWLIDAGVPVTDTHPNHPNDQPLHMACYQVGCCRICGGGGAWGQSN